MKLKSFKKDAEVARGLILALFITVCIVIAWAIIFKCNRTDQLNLIRNQSWSIWKRFTYRIIPFHSAYVVFRGGSVIGIIAFFANVLCFIPYGALFRFFTDTRTVIWSTLIVIFGVEIFQMLSGFGGFDFTDIFMNCLGAYIGCRVYNALRPCISGRAINVLALTFLATFTVMSVYGIVNTALNFPTI